MRRIQKNCVVAVALLLTAGFLMPVPIFLYAGDDNHNPKPAYEWRPNDLTMVVYEEDEEESNFFIVDYEHNTVEMIDINGSLYLLVFNGGFVSNSGIILRNGISYLPADTTAGLLGADVCYDESAGTVRIIKGDYRIDFDVDRNGAWGSDGAFYREDIVFLPLRYVFETMGYDVQFIDNFNLVADSSYREWIKELRSRISIIVIEQNSTGAEAHSMEEGLAAVKAQSLEMHQTIANYLDIVEGFFGERGRKAYDPFDIQYMDIDFGRYYVYKMAAFDYLIYYNKYTGDIFGEQVTFPFVVIRREFPNIEFLYQ